MASRLNSALMALKDAIREGHVSFRFEGRRGANVALWVELDGARDVGTGTWSCTMTTGDGRMTRKEFPEGDAENELTDAVLSIHDWLAVKEPKN